MPIIRTLSSSTNYLPPPPPPPQPSPHAESPEEEQKDLKSLKFVTLDTMIAVRIY